MVMSSEMRRLHNSWMDGTKWPKYLEWIEISGVRGWSGQRITFNFPITALVGENGSGKSTVLQAAAASYKSEPKDRYASDFFPNTPFERISGATVAYGYKQGKSHQEGTVRKPTNRWRGNPQRPTRPVEYIDLRRIQPVGARTGYALLLKAGVKEGLYSAFDDARLQRLSEIVGKKI